MYLARTPSIIQRIFHQFTWRSEASGKRLYLTFDDGPIPEVTPWVLDTLAEYNAKATFFCVGENVQRHPELFRRLTAEGHAVGNHTHNHLSGWTTDTGEYLANVRQCAQYVSSRLFRPPYGRIGPRTARALHGEFRIVMWDVLSGDFDPSIDGEACLRNVLDHVAPGSIVVFHDSLKSEANLRYALPRALAVLSRLGYSFEALSQQHHKGAGHAAAAATK